MADELTASGKYLLISVPDFANDPVGDPSADRRSQPMTSFLRMGAFHENMGNAGGAVQRAYELAQHAQIVSSGQGGHLTAPYGAEVNAADTGVEGRGVFLADQRTWNAADGTIPVPSRLEQSAALLNRGGWWDHSDGNRITTTYGDKVEVIRGNYKMVVMHRQDDPTMGGGWDLSGGHVQDLGPNSMPGASVRVEFRPGMFGKPGTWHLENTTNNFIQTSDYAGDFFEHWFGNLKQVTVGSETPMEWNEAKGKPYNNPEITEKTWASKIESYTGSAAWRIPTIKEETYALATSSLTDVTASIDETTYCDGTITSATGSAARRVPKLKESTYAIAAESLTDVGASIETSILGTSVSTTTVGAAAEVTTAGTSTSVTLVGASVDVTLAGALEEVTLAGHHGSVEVALHADDIFIGTKLGIQLGPVAEFEYPETKELKIKDLKAALDTTVTVLKYMHVGLQVTCAALTHNYPGMMVALGI